MRRRVIHYIDSQTSTGKKITMIENRQLFTSSSTENSPISWNSRKRQTIALSSTEAEYMAITESTKEALYLRKLLRSLYVDIDHHSTVYGDNLSSLVMTKPTLKQHQRSKYIGCNSVDIRYQFFCQQSEIICEHVPTEQTQRAILLTFWPNRKPRHVSSQYATWAHWGEVSVFNGKHI